MPLILTPPYLILLGAVALTLGAGEDAAGWILASIVILLVGLAALARGALRRRWIRRLRAEALPVRAEITGVVTAPFTVGGSAPGRLFCRGQTPPFVGRVFRSGWRLKTPGWPASLVTVLVDPRRTSRYLVDVEGGPNRVPLLQRGLRHLGAAAVVLGVGFVELVAIEFGRPAPPPGPVHGEVKANGSRFGKGGLQWRPDLCRVAANPGVTAIALLRKDDPYPVAWVIADPSSGVAALDVQQAQGAATVRFLPSSCTRLHGTVIKAPSGGPDRMKGYADAECTQEDAELTLHVDFAQCA